MKSFEQIIKNFIGPIRIGASAGKTLLFMWMKNDLKKRNLIHYGCSAPNDLLRELYESSQACGNIQNQNGKQLVDNYFNETLWFLLTTFEIIFAD